jgi:hypothetical protein
MTYASNVASALPEGGIPSIAACSTVTIISHRYAKPLIIPELSKWVK